LARKKTSGADEQQLATQEGGCQRGRDQGDNPERAKNQCGQAAEAGACKCRERRIIKEHPGRPIVGQFFRDPKDPLFAPVGFRKEIWERFVASAAVPIARETGAIFS
jgi:hypothetical protein